MKTLSVQNRFNLEAVIWASALIFLALSNPSTENHFTFCLFNDLGIGFCPGCGIGHSISYIFRLEFYESFSSHPLGIPAFIILTFRVIQLTRAQISINQNKIIPN